MSSFSAINLSRIAFPIAKRNLTIGLVVTCPAAGSLLASTPATSESGQTTNSQQVYSATLSHDDAHATLWMSDSAFFLDNQIRDCIHMAYRSTNQPCIIQIHVIHMQLLTESLNPACHVFVILSTLCHTEQFREPRNGYKLRYPDFSDGVPMAIVANQRLQQQLEVSCNIGKRDRGVIT
jgi:hypothetical protein